MGPQASTTRDDTADAALVLDAIRRIVRVLRVGARDAQTKAGVSAAQLFVLDRLAESSAVSMSELAARTLTDPSSVSTVVKRLAQKGLVSRLRSRADRRRFSIALTAKGRATLRKGPRSAQLRLIEGFERLAGPERRKLAGLLQLFVRAMDADHGAAGMLFEDEQPAPGRARRTRGST